jgi:hypothetical protein
MEMVPLGRSRHLVTIGYDPATKRMRIGFVSGAVYEYPDITAEEVEALRAAPSVGAHFARHHRHRASTKVEG